MSHTAYAIYKRPGKRKKTKKKKKTKKQPRKHKLKSTFWSVKTFPITFKVSDNTTFLLRAASKVLL